MERAIIIARYQEDVSWARLLTGYNLYIYNKFHKEGLQLPNVGREAHTYIHHILTHYDNLETINVFLQGDPFYHGADFLEKLERINEKTQFMSLGDGTVTWNTYENDAIHLFDLSIPKTFEWLFGKKCPPVFTYRSGALLVIHKDRIRKHPKEFYEKIMSYLETEYKAPWNMELMWNFVFTSNLDSVLKFG